MKAGRGGGVQKNSESAGFCLQAGPSSTEGWTQTIDWPVADFRGAVPIMTTRVAVAAEKWQL